jgi:DNA-binding MarR family transcriptional regulator
MVSEDVVKAVAFVKRGKNKQAVFLALDGHMMPSDIIIKVFGKKSEIAYSVVSRALSDLERESLVELLNPEEKTGRLYFLTKKGIAVQEFIRRQQTVSQKKILN